MVYRALGLGTPAFGTWDNGVPGFGTWDTGLQFLRLLQHTTYEFYNFPYLFTINWTLSDLGFGTWRLVTLAFRTSDTHGFRTWDTQGLEHKIPDFETSYAGLRDFGYNRL